MKHLLFFFYCVNVSWMWGCLVYMFVMLIRNKKGKDLKNYFDANIIYYAFIMVLFWLFYMVYQAIDSYYYLQNYNTSYFSIGFKTFIEGLNMISSICLTYIIVRGYKLNNKVK